MPGPFNPDHGTIPSEVTVTRDGPAVVVCGVSLSADAATEVVRRINQCLRRIEEERWQEERAARAELRAAELALRRLEEDLAFDHERARLGREHAAKRRQVGLLAVSQAGESADLTRARFQAGKALSAELITVEARLADARLQLAAAEADLISSDLAYRRAAGLPLISR